MVGCSTDNPYTLSIKPYPNRTEDFTLWQLEQYDGISQMGYIIKTDDNKIIVIDGGDKDSTVLLNDYIHQLGGTVHYWILTHPHKDHVGVLNQFLSKKSNILIENIIHSRLDLELVSNHEPISYQYIKDFYRLLDTSHIPLFEPSNGENLELAEGVQLRILGIKNPGIVVNFVNNSSLTFQIVSKSKNVIFTGDLGVEGGNKVLVNNEQSILKSTHVQMAHHGQDGVSKEFYQTVGAKVALWPTPLWLWENDLDAKGFNTGSWKTLIVRNWMDELSIAQNIVAGIEGTSQID